jgi:hypothetical protein
MQVWQDSGFLSPGVSGLSVGFQFQPGMMVICLQRHPVVAAEKLPGAVDLSIRWATFL